MDEVIRSTCAKRARRRGERLRRHEHPRPTSDGRPANMAARATAFLAEAEELYLTDLIVAETVYVLESF